LQGFLVLLTSVVLSFESDNPDKVEDNGLPSFGKVGVIILVSFLSSFLTGIISSINSSLIVTFGVKT